MKKKLFYAFYIEKIMYKRLCNKSPLVDYLGNSPQFRERGNHQLIVMPLPPPYEYQLPPRPRPPPPRSLTYSLEVTRARKFTFEQTYSYA